MTEPIEITFTVRAKVDPKAMFLRLAGATIEEGEWTGTELCTNVGGGSPVLSIKNDKLGIDTQSWISLQDLLHPWLEAVKLHERFNAPKCDAGKNIHTAECSRDCG